MSIVSIPPYRVPFLRGHDANPFDPAAEPRPLRVLLDAPLSIGPLDGEGAYASNPFDPGVPIGTPDAATLLRTCLTHKAIEPLYMAGDPDRVGAITFQEPDKAGDRLFQIPIPNGLWHSGITSYDQVLQEARELAARYQLSYDEALDGVLFSRVARQTYADVAVTDRQWLLDEAERTAPSAHVRPVNPADALALVALFLRSRSQTIFVGPEPITWRGGPYWETARAVLPAGWRWRDAAFDHSEKTGDRTLDALTAACFTRVARAIRVRDRLHRLSFYGGGENDEDILTDLDTILYLLVGAYDVTARVADEACGMAEPRKRNIAWQDPKWHKKLESPAPGLHDYTKAGGQMARIFAICRCLRNTVHNEAPNTTTVVSVQGMTSYVSLPPDEEAELLDLLGADASLWGVQRLPGGEIALTAGAFVDRLLPSVIETLDEIMRRTPVANLEGYDPAIETLGRRDQWDFSDGMAHRLGLMFSLL